MSVEFDFNFVPGLPVPVGKWSGFPKYNFVGGHNDAEHVPVDALIAAATSVLKREGFSLATYGLNSGPLGYRPLRDFLVGKLKSHAGIACEADEILITSGSLQGLDLVNSLLLSPGTPSWSSRIAMAARSAGSAAAVPRWSGFPSTPAGCGLMWLPTRSPISAGGASDPNTSTPFQPCKTRPGPSWVRSVVSSCCACRGRTECRSSRTNAIPI